MDEVKTVLNRALHAEGDARLVSVVQVLDAFNRGGLGYAMEYHDVSSFDAAADSARKLGADEVAAMIAAAAAITRQRGRSRDDAIAAFDRQYPVGALGDDLSAALAARLRDDPERFGVRR